jgi:hypothetical protein
VGTRLPYSAIRVSPGFIAMGRPPKIPTALMYHLTFMAVN